MIDMPSHNYLALQPGIVISAGLRSRLDDPTTYREIRDSGTLYGFDQAWLPAYRREARADCVPDLEFEIDLQRFLGTLNADDYLLVRAGPCCDYRGNWQDHPFRDVELVATVNLLFRRQSGALGRPIRSSQHITSVDVADVLQRAHSMLHLAKHALPTLDTHHLLADLHACSTAMRDGLSEPFRHRTDTTAERPRTEVA